MRALVTGGTGFVGASIVRDLVSEGWKVRALVRRGSPRGNLEGIEVETAEGDLRDPDSLRRAMAGCEALFHCAAHYALWVPRPAEIYESNVGGTANILRVAEALGVDRVVYTSTVAAVGLPKDGSPGTEEMVASPDEAIGHYKRSKILAELEARKAFERGLPVVTVNPSAPIGPLDIKPTPTGRIIVDFLNGRMPAYLDTGLNLVDVRDVARSHLLALEKGVPGERYILGNENLTLKEIFDRLARISGRPSPRVRLPYLVALVIAALDEGISGGVLRRPPRVTVSGVRMARKRMFFDSSKAVRVLGHPRTPVEKALRDAVDWFRENGYVG